MWLITMADDLGCISSECVVFQWPRIQWTASSCHKVNELLWKLPFSAFDAVALYLSVILLLRGALSFSFLFSGTGD